MQEEHRMQEHIKKLDAPKELQKSGVQNSDTETHEHRDTRTHTHSDLDEMHARRITEEGTIERQLTQLQFSSSSGFKGRRQHLHRHCNRRDRGGGGE
jgi:hypothetical protein